jgi:hypothetical protein
MIESIVYHRNSTVIKLEDLGVINIVSGMFVESDRKLINNAFFDANDKLDTFHHGMFRREQNEYFELEYRWYKSNKLPVRPLHWKEVAQKVEKFYEEFDGNQCFIYTHTYEMIEQFVIQNKTNLKLRYFEPEENGCKSFDNDSLAGAFDLNMEIR